MSSTIDPSIPPLKPTFTPNPDAEEKPATQALIKDLGLLKHIEGGYFKEIDRNPLIIPNPFLASTHDGNEEQSELGKTAGGPRSGDDSTRAASTSIYYLLTPNSPLGAFHRNKGRTVHTLIKGRGRYVLIHADEPGAKKRIETFVVGRNVAEGERVCWVVEGGKYKGTCLLEGDGEEGLLISETVIPGFEYTDHDFLTMERYKELVTEEQAEELAWMVRNGPKPEAEELL